MMNCYNYEFNYYHARRLVSLNEVWQAPLVVSPLVQRVSRFNEQPRFGSLARTLKVCWSRASCVMPRLYMISMELYDQRRRRRRRVCVIDVATDGMLLARSLASKLIHEFGSARTTTNKLRWRCFEEAAASMMTTNEQAIGMIEQNSFLVCFPRSS